MVISQAMYLETDGKSVEFETLENISYTVLV